MKKCSQCHIQKPLTEFYKDSSVKSGYRSACKKCWARQNYRLKKARETRQASPVTEDLGPVPEASYRALQNHIRAFLDLNQEERTIPTQLRGAPIPNKEGVILRRARDTVYVTMDTPRKKGRRTRPLHHETPRSICEYLWGHGIEVLHEEEAEHAGRG